MTSDANKRLVTRFVDGYQTGGDDRVLDELVHPDVVDHSRPPGISPGREGVREQFENFRAALAGFRATILHQVAEGDLVVTRKVFRGTHAGDLLGVAATGRDIEIGVIDIVRLEDGRIVEHWNLVDVYGVLAQLGAVPAPA
jgi:predicted ester cyclase